MHNSSLDTSHSARTLGFIFDEYLTFCDQITSLSKIIFVSFAVSGVSLIPQLSVPLLPL